MGRFPKIDPENMDERQKRVSDAIAGGPRGSVRGPFHALLYAPDVADLVQALGAHVRYAISIPWSLREIAILVTAKHWNAQYEWYAHEKEAQKAGTDQAIIDAIREGRRPDFSPDQSAEADIYAFATELYENRSISDAPFDKISNAHGKEGAIELVALMGHYNVIAMTLNVAEVEVPSGDRPLG